MRKSRRAAAPSAEAGEDSSDNNEAASPPRDTAVAATATEESSNSNAQGPSSESRKRPRLRRDDPQSLTSGSASNGSSAACDQCRFRKVRCDRQQPECSNCRKAGIACNQTSNFKRLTTRGTNRRDDFSSVLYRLDELDETLGTLTKLIKQCTDRPLPLALAGLNSFRQQGEEQQEAFPSPSITPTSRPKSPGLGNIWPSLVLPSSQQELGQSDEVFGKSDASSEDEFPTMRVELEHGGERTYKYPASMTLLRTLTKRLAGSCQISDTDINDDRTGYSANASTRAMVLRLLDCFPFQGKCLQPVIHSDRRPVVAPPQMIARLFIDGFLRNINSRIPVFDEKALRDAVDFYYADLSHMPSSMSSASSSVPPTGDRTSDGSWAIIFNNIALLELGLETHVTQWQGNLAGSSPISTSLLTEDLISSFLRNCDRALADLTPYTRPSLLHVQALLTLALVAQEFYGNILFEKVLQTACHVGRMLGLHLSKTHGNVAGESPKDRNRVFRVLYGLDKQRVFLTGDPCDLYHFDSDRGLWESEKSEPGEVESPNRKLIVAFDDMMIIWEEVYLKLYSARAVAAGVTFLSSQVSGLMQLLTKWHDSHPGLIEATASQLAHGGNTTIGPSTQSSLGGHDVEDLVLMQLELRYCYHVTHVLVLRSDRNKDERIQTQILHHARACLRLVVEMGNLGDGVQLTPSRTAKARVAALSRVLGSYPMVAFMDLVAFRLDEFIASRLQPGSDLAHSEPQDVAADMELLQAVPRILQGLQHPDRPSTYINRLRAGMGWAAWVLDETRKAWIMGPQSGEMSVMIPSSPVMGPIAVSADGSTTIINSSLMGSSWEHLSSLLRQHPQQLQRLNTATSSEMMDLDARMPPSTRPQLSAISGYTPGTLELDGASFGGMYDPIEDWSTVPFLDGMGEDGAGGGPHMTCTSTVACGFNSLDLWQDSLHTNEAGLGSKKIGHPPIAHSR
ncbi:putative Zn(2)-C6 fungal-type domain-containing protein [Seiridium unicorne]|uniref:Zn(2)-C6 fungal-type domain-containing protein n=1 Tax=Seiridium unicorne TaxID=138068 RepID=A0ABR2V4P2_9PEZI